MLPQLRCEKVRQVCTDFCLGDTVNKECLVREAEVKS